MFRAKTDKDYRNLLILSIVLSLVLPFVIYVLQFSLYPLGLDNSRLLVPLRIVSDILQWISRFAGYISIGIVFYGLVLYRFQEWFFLLVPRLLSLTFNLCYTVILALRSTNSKLLDISFFTSILTLVFFNFILYLIIQSIVTNLKHTVLLKYIISVSVYYMVHFIYAICMNIIAATQTGKNIVKYIFASLFNEFYAFIIMVAVYWVIYLLLHWTPKKSLLNIIITKIKRYRTNSENEFAPSYAKAGLEDADDIGSIHALSWQAAYHGIVPDEYLATFTPGNQAERFRSTLLNSTEASYLISVRHVSAGMLVLGRSLEVETDLIGEISALYFLPQYWGKGYGAKAMTFAIERLRESGCSKVQLWVLADNLRARRFYEKCGFSFDGTTKEIALGISLTEMRYVLELKPQ